MSNLNYTNWWRNGTIGATKNSTEITGASTYWSTTNINPGDIFIDNSGIYEIQNVTDDTHLTLATPYLGETGTGLAYAIIRNFTATTNAKVAAMTSELMYEFARFIDKERSTITGKSAYEIAKDNGYVGTEAQWLESLSAYGQAKKNGYTGTLAEWLESLKAAGEWSSADSRLAALETKLQHFPQIDSACAQYAHNLYPRFKNLGNTITNAQYAMIRKSTYDDLYIGDYWELTVGDTEMTAMIVQLGGNHEHGGEADFAENAQYNRCAHIFLFTNRKYPMNDTDTNAGGYAASKMHTEIMPALTTELEATIGAEHIFLLNRNIINGTTVDNTGKPNSIIRVSSKLDIPMLDDVVNFKNRNWGLGNIPLDYWQGNAFALFQVMTRGVLIGHRGIGIHGNFWNCWLQEARTDNAAHFMTGSLTTGSYNWQPATTEYATVAHFILIG